MTALPDGVVHMPNYLDVQSQGELVETVREAVRVAPLFTPAMPRTGKEMSVRMTNFGNLGWVTDKERGYRYQTIHPITENPWPPIPKILLSLWNDVSGCSLPPEACLVNFYSDKAKMGLHQDRDEKNFEAPVVSISLGNSCLFRVGSDKRGGKTHSVRLESGDVIILSGASRLAYHGVDRIYPNSNDLLKGGGRVNLTLRRVTAAGEKEPV